MKKEILVKAIIEVIRQKAEQMCLQVENRGEGHGYDGTVWKDILTDNSEIPNIIAKNEKGDYSIQLRSYWGKPEIGIRVKGELMVLNYSDVVKDENGDFINTGDYAVYGVEVHTYNYKTRLEGIYALIESISEVYNTLDANRQGENNTGNQTEIF